MNVLELYSGIGGMHLALEDSGVNGKIVAAVEINPVANKIYQHNFPDTELFNLNIQGLTADFINKLNVDTILMSPPCQPFTRNGLQNDINDARTDSFQHILSLLPNLSIDNILIENVKGFEASKMREQLIDTLQKNNFVFQEFILSPHQLGIPNSRHRYYCLAKKFPRNFVFKVGPLMYQIPDSIEEQICFPISDILDAEVDKKYFLTDNILEKRINVLDICYKESRRSCCFTKAYSRFLEGTGSVFTNKKESDVLELLAKVNNTDDKKTLLRNLDLRFFTPREVCRLMCFPDSFTFPNEISDRNKYKVLGNSINITVVAKLIKILNAT